MSEKGRQILPGLAERRAPADGDRAAPRGDLPAPPGPAGAWYRRPLPVAAAVATVAVLLLGSLWWYRYAVTHESTDDAFIAADVVSVSPKVASYVAQVLVGDNQLVRAGQVLVELDPRDFDARLAQARANLQAARARYHAATINVQVIGTTSAATVQEAEAGVQAAEQQAEGARSRLAQARAAVAAAAAEAARAAAEGARYDRLIQFHADSQSERDRAVALSRTTAADLEAAQRGEQAAADAIRQAEAQLGQARAHLASAKAAPEEVAYSRAQADQAAAEITQLEAAVQQAELNRSYASILAPEAGRITKKNVEPGDYVQVGQPLFAIVPEHVWVVANFKENQLAHMRPGQPATVTVDAYPDRVFRGHVDSIQAGSGAAFSLLPPENATGNYVKVVQRVPVKIVLDDSPDPVHPLGPGMSVVPTVALR